MKDGPGRSRTELREQYNKGYGAGYEAGDDVGFASADDWLDDNEAEMAKHGWVKLPVDADGVPIRVGDDVVDFDTDERFQVRRIKLDEAGWDVVDRLGSSYFPCFIRHVRQGAVENLLREFFYRFAMPKPGEEVDAILAEYAAKLRLADDGEVQQ